MRSWEQLIPGGGGNLVSSKSFKMLGFVLLFTREKLSHPKKWSLFFYKQDWKNTKRKNPGLAAAPPDSVEQILHLHAASPLACIREEPRRRGGRPQGRTAQTARRLQGKQNISKTGNRSVRWASESKRLRYFPHCTDEAAETKKKCDWKFKAQEWTHR